MLRFASSNEASAMTYSLFFFDLDGTLVDSLPDIASALNQALAEKGLPSLPQKTVQTLVGEGVHVLAERALEAVASSTSSVPDAQSIATRITEIYRARPCEKTTLYPGTLETLTTLRSTPGRHLMVLTNKPGEVARPLLQALEASFLFDAVIGDGDGYPKKPDPTAILTTQKRLGIPPESTLVVGDGIPDMQVAAAAGCPAAAALWGYTPPDKLAGHTPRYLLRTFRELLTVA